MSYRGPCVLPHLEIHFTRVETGPGKGCSDTSPRIDTGKQEGIKQKKTMTVRASHSTSWQEHPIFERSSSPRTASKSNLC